jgi:phosphotriesterase-related protein
VTTVNTVSGPVDSADLGNVLVHEHIFILDEEHRLNHPDEWDEEAMITQAVQALAELKELGIDTIMDPTVLGLGRYIPRIQRIAEKVSLKIIVATGVYTSHDIPVPFALRGPGLLFDEPEPMTADFVRELREGIAETRVRPAFLKCVIDEPGLVPAVERIMRAVAQASIATGAPITVHTNAALETGLIVQRVFTEEGVDLRKVIIGHSGDTTNLDYLMRLADAGSILGMDRFGLDPLLSFEDRVDTVAALVARGYVDRMALSHDTACHCDGFPASQRERLMPRWNYRHISEDVLPALRQRGVSDADIHTMLAEVPRRYFE